MGCFHLVFFSEPLIAYASTGCHEEKYLFSLSRKLFSTSHTLMEKVMTPLYLSSFVCTICLCFVHCQFKLLLNWNCIAHTQCICSLSIRKLEIVPVITNTSASQPHQFQARPLESHHHPSTLRNPKIH